MFCFKKSDEVLNKGVLFIIVMCYFCNFIVLSYYRRRRFVRVVVFVCSFWFFMWYIVVWLFLVFIMNVYLKKKWELEFKLKFVKVLCMGDFMND